MIEPENINSSDTVPLPVVDEPRRAPKPPNATQLLADGLDWLQYDMSQHDQNAVAHHTRTSIGLNEVKIQGKHIERILIVVAVLLLLNAALMGEVIYRLGLLIGHVR